MLVLKSEHGGWEKMQKCSRKFAGDDRRNGRGINLETLGVGARGEEMSFNSRPG